MSFTEQDVKSAQRFGELVVKHAQWNLTTPVAIELVKLMSWYNQATQKMEANVMELRSVTTPKPAPEPAPTKRGRQARGS